MNKQQNINFSKLISLLGEQFKHPLPGKDVQNEMAPSYRNDYNSKNKKPIESSVLLLFFEKENEAYLTLMKRSSKLRNHSGQISFPGGKWDKTDKSAMQTSLRETKEELGIDTDNIYILGTLTPLYIPISNFMVYSFVGYINEQPVFKPNPTEVDEVISFPVKELFNENSLMKESWTKNDKLFTRPYFSFNEYKIWGATSMIMNELKEIITQETS